MQAREVKAQKFLAEAVDKELAKFPKDLQGKLRDAVKTPEGQRSPEQKKLLAGNPSVNISPGVLYQYNAAAADELKNDQARIDAVRARKRVEEFVSVLDEIPGVLPETRVFHRGDHRQPTQAVGAGDLSILAPASTPRFETIAKDPKLPTSGRRLAFAKHLVDGRHPLVGRVLANRVWLHHFGRGLVDTPGDFGMLGHRPTHPELLDWLAAEIVRQRWSLKALHRLIMTSMAYRQSSRRDPPDGTPDTEDAWYGRFPLRRLDAEALRDRILVVSGRLDPTPFGRPVPVNEDTVGQVLPANDSPRRSIYLEVRRTKPVSLLAAFDSPVMAVNCDLRVNTTSAPQSLMLMNSDFILGHAQAMAKRIRAETSPRADMPRLIAHAWELAYNRPISSEEQDWTRAFVTKQLDALARANAGADRELTVLTNLCQQLLTSNEFLYAD